MALEPGTIPDWQKATKRFRRFQPEQKEPPPSEWLVMLYSCAHPFRAISSLRLGLVKATKSAWYALVGKLTGRKNEAESNSV